MEAYNPRFDLVILDLLLPGKLSGADVFLALRKTFSADQLPIIVITAVDEATLEQFRRILPDDVFVLRKPFPPKVLLEAVAQVRNDRGLDEE
jgi:DNA-binding response OmpR family regulator